MSAASDINTLVAEARAAIRGGDNVTARSRLLEAQAALIAIPRSKRGESELEYTKSDIATLIAAVTADRDAATGMQTTKVTYGRATP